MVGVRTGDLPLTGEVDLEGAWEFEAELPDGTTSVSDLTIEKAADGTLSGVLSTELGEAIIAKFVLDGNALSYVAEIDMFSGDSGRDSFGYRAHTAARDAARDAR